MNDPTTEAFKHALTALCKAWDDMNETCVRIGDVISKSFESLGVWPTFEEITRMILPRSDFRNRGFRWRQIEAARKRSNRGD